MLTIERICSYVIPMFGNKRCLPYGSVLVSGGSERKVCQIKDDTAGNQYITFNRRRYRVANAGTLYNPNFKIMEA